MIELSGLPNNFVIKPSNLNSARGVQIIEKREDGSLFDHFRNEATSLERIVEVQKKEFDKIQSKEPQRVKAFRVIAQERIEDSYSNDSVPTDFKFWVVGGKVQLVFQSAERSTGRLAICFYDNNFEPLPYENELVVVKDDAQSADHVNLPSIVRNEMIAIAERAANAIPADFIRVDLYASKDGVKLGELTPIPGSPVNGKVFSFTDKFEEQLGQIWSEALSK